MTNTTLTIQDINGTINHEPRIKDIDLARFLGFAQPVNIRKLIVRHKEALEKFGEVFSTVEKTTPKGGRPSTVYYPNKKQCTYLCIKSETPEATEKAIEVVEVYDAYTSGTLQPQKQPVETQLTPDPLIYGTETMTVLRRPYETALAMMELLATGRHTHERVKSYAELGYGWMKTAALSESNQRRLGVA